MGAGMDGRRLRSAAMVVAMAIGIAGGLGRATAAEATGDDPPAPTVEEPSGPAGARAAPPRPAAATTRVFGAWRLTCRSGAAEGRPQGCVAVLQVAKKENAQAVFVWRLGRIADGRLVTSFVTLTGVAIKPGVELALGRAPLRRVGFSTCEPTQCTANAVVDEALTQDLLAVDKATIVVRGSNGKAMTLEVPLAGTGEVLAALRR